MKRRINVLMLSLLIELLWGSISYANAPSNDAIGESMILQTESINQLVTKMMKLL